MGYNNNMVTVDSPTTCKIFLKRKNNNSFELTELLLTQVFNYKISENKRPVYGFNKLDFEQVVRGKRLFEGIIVIKKSMISDIGKIVDIGTPTIKDELKYSEKKIEYLKNIFKEDRAIKSKLEDYYQRAKEEYEIKQRAYLNTKNADILNELPDGTSIILAFGTYAQTEDFQTEYNKIVNNNETDYGSFENILSSNNDFIIESVNFFEKTGEVNISKNDIDEVYKFFGKLATWSDA